MECPIAKLEATIIKHLLDSKRFPLSDITNMLMDMKGAKTATTAIRMIINRGVTIRICMEKKVISTNNKTTEGMSTVMEDTAGVILTLALQLNSTSRRMALYLFLLSLVANSKVIATPDMHLHQLLTLVSSNTTVATRQIKTTMVCLTLNTSALSSTTGKPAKLLRHTLSIRGVMAGGRLCLCVCRSV